VCPGHRDEWNNDNKGTDLRQTPGCGPKKEGEKNQRVKQQKDQLARIKKNEKLD
jgi:hypothetical protein